MTPLLHQREYICIYKCMIHLCLCLLKVVDTIVSLCTYPVPSPLYLAHKQHYAHIGLLLIRPLFPRYYYLQILYTTNFLIENVFNYVLTIVCWGLIGD